MKKNPIVKEAAIPAGLGKILLAHLIPDAKNPRKDLKKGDPEFEKIQNSIGKFGQLDPIIYNTRTRKILGGHQRLKVLDDKGYTELFTVTLGAYTWAFAEADLKELSEKEESAANIALNKAQGDWNIDQLVLNLQELKAEGMDISITGFDEAGFNQMVENLNGLVIDDPSKEWQGMPEFKQENKMGVKEVIVHFETWENRESFAKLVGQNITEQTKYIWYPKQELHRTKGLEYGTEDT